jgi:hypothetical protein
MLYETIRNHNIRATKADCMLDGLHKMAPYQDGMVDMGDGRLLGGGLKMAFTTKRIITTSFNPDWTCTRCEQHVIRSALRMNGEAGSAPRQVFVLADQNFPAALPVSSSQQCLKILRIENAPLQDLEDEFIKQVGNRRIMPGSLILVLSPAHLANVGISAYISYYTS